MKAAETSAPKTPNKTRVPKPGDSPVKKGAATENCDPNVSAKRTTPAKVFRARTAASPKKELEQLLAPASEERHTRSPVEGEAARVVEVASSPPGGKAANLKSDTSPKKRLEQSLTPSAAGDHHPSCIAHAKSLQNGSGATTPARKHICKSARCAANDPDYAVPAPTPPRKFLLSKRHILQQQLEESLKRYKKCCPDVGAAGHLDPVENVQLQAEEARISTLVPGETGGRQPVDDPLCKGLEPDSEGAEPADVQDAEPVGMEETESGGTKAEDKLAGTRVMEAGVPEGMKEVAPEHMPAEEAVVSEDMQAAESVVPEGIEAADMVDFKRMEEVETVVPECMEGGEAVAPGDTEVIDASEGTGPLATEGLKELRAFGCPEVPEVPEEFSQEGKEPAHAITLDGKAVPEGLEETDEAELVDALQNRSLPGKDMEAAEPADELLESNPTSDSEWVEAETSGDEEWVFLDPSTALLDDDIDSTLVTDDSGRLSLVGNYLTGRVWGRRKSSTTCPVTDTEAVNLRKQASSSRKLSSEWKLDHAITEALAGKDPYGEGRVRTLVEAFEKVISFTECDRVLPRHAYRKFSLCPRQKQVSVTGPQPDSETPQPTELGVEWVKVDIMTASNLEDEEEGAELGAGIRDSVASLISNHVFGYTEVMTACKLEAEEAGEELGAGIRGSVASLLSYHGLVTAFVGKQEQGSEKDMETVHNNFAGIDLWKHSIFAAPAKQVEHSQSGVGSGLDSSGNLEDCHSGRGNTGDVDGQAAQLGDADYGMRHTIHPESPSELEGSEYAISVSYAEEQSDSKYGRGYTCRLRGSQIEASYQYRTGELDDNQDLVGYHSDSHDLESEDGKCATEDPVHAKGFEVLECYDRVIERTKGDKRRLSEGDADNHRRDSSSDHATGQACDRQRGAPHRRPIATTEPQPFKLHTEERGAMHDMAFARKMEQIFAEEARLRIPIARGLPWTTDEPEVVPKPPVKEQTRPVEFRLLSTARAMDRAEFDRYVAESQRYYEEQRQQEQRLHQMTEEEEVRRLRHQMVPRAQLMPYFDQPFQPRRSSKRLTVPKEPNFHSPNKRSKCPGAARWNVGSLT